MAIKPSILNVTAKFEIMDHKTLSVHGQLLNIIAKFEITDLKQGSENLACTWPK